MQLSSLLSRFNESETIKMAAMARTLKAQGKDVTDLSVGEPDFDVPEHIKQAAIKAIQDNYSHYTPVSGYPDLKDAIIHKLKRDNNLTYLPENIVVSTGAKQSITNLILALIDAGDEVIIPTPYWVSYSDIVQMATGVPKLIRTSIKNNFKLTPQELEANITSKTKLFMFSSPSNPSGTFYNKQELEGLVKVLEKHPNIYIMSDEIYEYINYVGKHESIAQFENIKNRTIVINGMSKGFAMTGWRLGYMAAPTPIAKACDKIQAQVTSGANSVAQKASITALLSDLKTTQEMQAEFTKRRAFMVNAFKQIPNINIIEPEGAFYVFPDCSAYIGKSFNTKKMNTIDDLAMYLLEDGLVSCVSGKAFGEPNCIRFSFANSMPNLEKAAQKLKNAFAALK